MRRQGQSTLVRASSETRVDVERDSSATRVDGTELTKWAAEVDEERGRPVEMDVEGDTVRIASETVVAGVGVSVSRDEKRLGLAQLFGLDVPSVAAKPGGEDDMVTMAVGASGTRKGSMVFVKSESLFVVHVLAFCGGDDG